ncbi:MAG: hypothetical protein ACRDRP_16510 [Pseudonocardiaceae bacterium]
MSSRAHGGAALHWAVFQLPAHLVDLVIVRSVVHGGAVRVLVSDISPTRVVDAVASVLVADADTPSEPPRRHCWRGCTAGDPLRVGPDRRGAT